MVKQLKLAGKFLLAPFVIFGCGRVADKEPAKPNILYIMSDDHTSQAWGIYGGILLDYVHTPNIRLLAEQGCVLENCLVSNSISVPSRATILTGQYSHVNGVKTLGYELPPENYNMAEQYPDKVNYLMGKMKQKIADGRSKLYQ